MKYKKGDRVVIKPWAMMVEQYGVCGSGEPKTGETMFLESMENNLAGTDRTVEIQSNSDVYYHGTEKFDWKFTDKMILGYAFEWGEEIEVSDDGKNWKKVKFTAYTCRLPDDCFFVSTAYGTYRYARPIRKTVIEIDVKVNGEIVSLSDISEATLLKIRNS